MDIRKILSGHLNSLPGSDSNSEISFSRPVETQEGRFTILCFVNGEEKSIVKIVCTIDESSKVRVNFLPLKKLNETGGYVPVPTNVKDIYSQYFQPLQVQTMMANDRMMVG